MTRGGKTPDAEVAPSPAVERLAVQAPVAFGNFVALSGMLVRRVVNQAVAVSLIVAGAPLFVVIALLILAVDGRPVLYRGRRLGFRKRPFTMYKFRTLARGASGVIGSGLLSFRHRVMIPGGKFLRDTRLDELPQLFNILGGDMNFVGPRPVRPEVYASLCKHLKGYDRRFAVKPGLVGFSQLFTPHSSPKRLRAHVDNRVMQSRSYPFRGALCLAYAVVAVAETAAGRLLRCAWQDIVRTRILRLHRNRRELTRVRARNARVRIQVDNERTVEAPLVDINETAFLLQSSDRLAEGSAPLRLRIEVRFQRRLRPSSTRVRIARCTGSVSQTRRVNGGWRHVVAYDPATEWSQYLVDQYLLRGSLASPFRAANPGFDGRSRERRVSRGTEES